MHYCFLSVKIRKEKSMKETGLARKILDCLKFFILLPIAKIKYGKRHIWLITERGNDARDNGMHFFKYMRTKHPETEVYYVIDKSSSDLKNIEEYGNIVENKSLEHFMLYCVADVIISTHLTLCSPGATSFGGLRKKGIVHGKFVSLKHGFTKDMIGGLKYSSTHLDMLVSCAKPEYDYFVKYFGYPEGNVKYTGFARFDALHENNETKRQILFMPTWRKYFWNYTDEQIENSDFIKKWSGLMKDERLIKALEEKGVQVVFYPHIAVQKFLPLFDAGSSNIVIADFDHYDVQQLLKESKVLVTDFSSVFADFAYMRKPTVYFQFDTELYREGHYTEGYYDYKTMAFGDVTEEIDETVDLLVQYIENDFEVRDEFKEEFYRRVDEFFPLNDNHNCDRIYEGIQEILKK